MSVDMPSSISRLCVNRLVLNQVTVGYRFNVIASSQNFILDIRIEHLKAGVKLFLDKHKLSSVQVHEIDGYFVSTEGSVSGNCTNPSSDYDLVVYFIDKYIMHFGSAFNTTSTMTPIETQRYSKGLAICLKEISVLKGTSMREAHILVQADKPQDFYTFKDILVAQAVHLQYAQIDGASTNLYVVKTSLATLFSILKQHHYILTLSTHCMVTKSTGSQKVSNLIMGSFISDMKSSNIVLDSQYYEPMGGLINWQNKLEGLRLNGLLVYTLGLDYFRNPKGG